MMTDDIANRCDEEKDAENSHATDAAPALSPRARVRRVFVEPLLADGLKRAKGVTDEAHQAFVEKLCDRLAYLDEALLTTLREVVLSLATGQLRNTWPVYATILNNAALLRQPPDDDRHIMTTWLRSIEGPRARDNGTLVELHSFLRRHGRPPNSFDLNGPNGIVARAAENRRRRAVIVEWVTAGRAPPEDVAWLNAYAERLTYCEALVRDGCAARAAKPATDPVPLSPGAAA
jgi:hypothetical protein